MHTHDPPKGDHETRAIAELHMVAIQSVQPKFFVQDGALRLSMATGTEG